MEKSLRVVGPLAAGEVLVIDTGMVTAKVTDSAGNTAAKRPALFGGIEFPSAAGCRISEIAVEGSAVFTELHIQAKEPMEVSDGSKNYFDCTRRTLPANFHLQWAKAGLWRLNESEPDSNDRLMDSSGNGGISILSTGAAPQPICWKVCVDIFRFNINNPCREKTYLCAVNDGSIFSELGRRIVVGGWMNPTIYSVGNTFLPYF
ncbi:MAG: hypothetical protein ACLUOO_02805 [Coprococcus sp.]